MITCSLMSGVLAAGNLVPVQHISSARQFGKVTVLALVFCLSVVLGNISLKYIPVSFNQVRSRRFDALACVSVLVSPSASVFSRLLRGCSNMHTHRHMLEVARVAARQLPGALLESARSSLTRRTRMPRRPSVRRPPCSPPSCRSSRSGSVRADVCTWR